MSVLEIKGEMHELITQVQNHASAQQLLELIRNFLQSQSGLTGDDDDFEEHITDEQVASLQEAIELSYDKKNLIPQTEAKKMIQLWLSQKQSNG